MRGLSNEEYDQAMDELKEHPTYRHIVPAAIGVMLGGASLIPAWNRKESWNGVMSWNPDPKAHEATGSSDYMSPGIGKHGSFDLQPSDYWCNNMAVDLDYSKTVGGNDVYNMFSKLPDYERNFCTAVTANAQQMDQSRNIRLGTLQDSMAEKLSNKLSWEGVANVAARSVISNTAARLFTNAVDAVVGLDPDTKRNIVDGSTWAGAISSILL
jgi:hypothetical protein